jgi:hypothetical protein
MSNEVEEIDVTKTLIFLLVSLFVTLVITAAMIIPDIKALKIKKIESERAIRQHKEIRLYHQKLNENYADLQKRNSQTLNALENSINKSELIESGHNIMGDFKVDSLMVNKEHNQTIFEITDINASAIVHEPRNFYKFVDYLAAGHNLIEVGFPILIEVQEDYKLSIGFNMTSYYTLPKQ